MKNIGILAVAGIAALIMGFGANLGTQSAHAEVDASVVIPCEFIFDEIDGDTTDATSGADQTEACDGLDSTDVANLAAALGDEDDVLEASDFEDKDLDLNQITSIDDSGDPTNVYEWTYGIAFVDNDGQTSFDSETGLSVIVNDDGGAAEAAPADDANSETCDGDDDLDCGTTTLDNGDGVVVAILLDGTADPGDDVDVDIFQSDDTAQISTETITVTGAPDNVSIEAVLGKDIIQISGSSTDQDDCEDDSEISDTDQLADLNRTFVKATVTDNDDVELTRAVVDFDSDDEDIASIDDDSGEDADEPNADSGESVDGGEVAGVGAFAVVCGGTDTGVASITATINDGDPTEEDASVDINVVGEPENVAVTASPAIIDCNGVSTATVSATVTDANGDNVANGTNVNFSVVALGTANPINADTADGVATSTITPLSGATAGVTVIVTAGDAQASIRVDCNTAAAATATPGGPGAVPTVRPGGTIGGPDTGNGGYLGQDSAGFPAWTLVALALGSMALVAGGMVTRRAGK